MSFPLASVSEIENFLALHYIRDYDISTDLVVDVHGALKLDYLGLTHLPFQFGVVEGYFDISHNKLTTLYGSPSKINGFFNCSNNKLKSLEYAPSGAHSIECEKNQIESLQYCPQDISSLNCRSNRLKTLEGVPENLRHSFNCSKNKLKTLANGPKTVGLTYTCGDNPLVSLEGFDTLLVGEHASFYHYTTKKPEWQLPEFAGLYTKCKATPNDTQMGVTLSGAELRSILLAQKLDTGLSDNSPSQKKLKL